MLQTGRTLPEPGVSMSARSGEQATRRLRHNAEMLPGDD